MLPLTMTSQSHTVHLVCWTLTFVYKNTLITLCDNMSSCFSDGCLLLDAYSHVVNIGKSTRFSWSGRLPRINSESVEALRDMKFPFVPFINEKSEPGSFVKLEGMLTTQ